MDIDTSSYPKLPVQQQQNPLDTISKLQGIQEKGLTIDKQKLENYNQKYNIIHRSLGNLVNEPELSGNHFINTYQDMVKAGVMTPDQAAKEMSMVPTKAGSKSPEDYNRRLRQLAETQLLQAQEKHDALTHYFGTNATIDTGGHVVSGSQGQIKPTGVGAGPSGFSQGSVTGKEMAPGTPGIDTTPGSPNFGNPTFNPGSQPPITTPVNKSGLPIAAPVTGKSDQPPRIPTKLSNGPVVGEAGNTNERVGQGATSNFAPAPPAQFIEGQKQFNEDIASGSAKLQAIKPAQQALKLMTPEVLSGLTGTGPIGNALTKGISSINGVLGLKGDLADRVAIRQEIVKKMKAYVSQSPVAGRSDSAQILAEASSPDPNVQSLKALVNLTRDAIALDRIHAAKAQDFAVDDKGNAIKNPNYAEYPVKRSRFPNAVDEDAFKLDSMSKEERKELQERKEQESPAAQQKFRNSVAIARKLGMY